VGQVLVAARLARGWSQRELAARLQVHESQVSRDERYEYQGITVERLQGLCDVLGLDLDTVPRLRGATRELRTAAAPSIPPEANPPSSGTPAIPHVRRTPGWSPAVPAPAAGGQSRSAGWSQTNLPTAPHAGRRWLSAPQLSRLAAAPKGEAGSTANDEPEGESAVAASLPRLGVFFMTGSPTAGATGGATGPLGPFVYQSQSYASAQSHDYAARANSYAAESEECAAARRDIAA
jgi:transcriptional regulator with XRE-family HTH domain